jgi:CubicO group peptidase (beta-lactamase class C family)
MRRTPIRSILALLVLGFSGCAHVPAHEGRFAGLDAMLETQAQALMLPGVSAALMVRGELVWTGARGWADIETQRPMIPETAFNIASLTKPMTAVILMQLVERGALSLETPMQRYDPAFTDPRITVGHVLSMTSESDPPGSRYAYNGNPYGKLGNVITGVTGETLSQAFSTRLIEPLGLTHTAPGAIAADERGLSAERIAHYRGIMARSAVPYNIYGGVEPVATIPPDPTLDAAANVLGTASDYARFADAVMRGRLLRPATLAAMWTPAVAPSGERLAYAYGWFVGEYQGHRVIYHYGYYPDAWSAVALIVPERELVFVALANGHGLNAGNGIGAVEGHVMACAVLRAFVDAALPCAEASAANVARWRAQVPPPQPEIASDPATLPRYAGVYRRPNGGEASVLIDRDRLWWQSPAGRFLLTQVGPDRFVMKADNRIMAFVLDAGGNVTRIDVTYPGDPNTYVVPRLR